MTLPEALLKRLAKRGIIQGDGAAVATQPSQPHSADPSSDKDESEYSSEQTDDDDDDSADDRRDSENEEIIAEDYDEYDHVNPDAFEYPVKKKSAPGFDWTEKMKQKMTKRYGYQSVDGCQNKYNIHHLCTMYCVKRYGEVEFEIEKEYDKRVKRLLERYPLPKNWRKEYDIGCKAFYFYNKDTRIVSWLPPTHPDAKMTKSAKLLRRELMEQIKEKETGSKAHPAPPPETYPLPQHPSGPMPQQAVVGPIAENLKPPIVNPPKRPFKHPLSRDDEKRSRPGAPVGGIKPDRDRGDYRDRNRDRERDRDRLRDRDRDRDRERRDRERSPTARTEDYRPGREKERDRDRVRDREREREGGRGKQPKNATPLDPMDPAAYSDIPRGNWASGLEAASGAGSKKEKEDKKKSKPKEDSEDEHEVLKISTLKEFSQEDEEDNEADE